MTIPSTYRRSSAAIVSYNYVDIASGTGTQIFYAAPVIDSSGTTYILTQSTFPGAGDINGKSVLEGNEPEHDFDLTAFSIPQTVKGVAVISCTNFNVNLSSSCKFRLKKWDGSSETNISAEITSATNTSTTELLIELPLTETQFKKGDVLRLTIDFGGTNISQGIGIDPSGQSTNTAGALVLQPFRIAIPFKIDL